MLLKKILPVLLVIVLSACGGGSAQTSNVTVTMTEFGFEPNVIEVKAGIPVELTLINAGAIEHDFVIEVIPVQDVSTQGMEADHMSGDHSEYDLHSATAAGNTSTLVFTATEPGTYKIICSVPGHFDAGMTGELIVK